MKHMTSMTRQDGEQLVVDKLVVTDGTSILSSLVVAIGVVQVIAVFDHLTLNGVVAAVAYRIHQRKGGP